MTNGEPPAPQRVTSIETYWQESPPEMSARCRWWIQRISLRGWRRNARVATLGYYGSAQYFGVYVWEWIEILSPLLLGIEAKEARA